MERQSLKDDLIASAVNVLGTSVSNTDLTARPGVLLGELSLIVDVTFNGALTDATVLLEFYLKTSDKWYPAFDAMQQAIEVIFTATTDHYALLSNQGPARIAHTGQPLVADLWRLALDANGGIGTSADFTIHGRHFERRHNLHHV